MNDWNKLYTRAENLLSRLEGLLPGAKPEPTGTPPWLSAGENTAALRDLIQPVAHPHHISWESCKESTRKKGS